MLLFTDGLTDSISGDDPQQSLRDALADDSGTIMSHLIALVEPQLNEDDVTILLVKRAQGSGAGDGANTARR